MADRGSQEGARRSLGGGIVLLLLLTALSCWPWRDDPGSWAGEPRSTEIRLEVRNQNFNDAVLYLLPNGQRRRLGVVTGLTSDSFDLAAHPEVLQGYVRLAAQPIGSRETYVTDPISAFPGDQVILTLTSQLRMSHWHVRE